VGASRLNSEVRVKAIVSKKQGDACALIDLVIYSKLGKRQVVNPIVLCEANKSTEVLIYGSVNDFSLAIRFWVLG